MEGEIRRGFSLRLAGIRGSAFLGYAMILLRFKATRRASSAV